jgi:hypothetical protein
MPVILLTTWEAEIRRIAVIYMILAKHVRAKELRHFFKHPSYLLELSNKKKAALDAVPNLWLCFQSYKLINSIYCKVRYQILLTD